MKIFNLKSVRTFSISLVLFVITACATPVERAFTTASNSPEVTINTSVDNITNYIVNDFVDKGYSINKQSSNSIELERSLNSSEEFVVALSVGNSYSNNSRVSKFSFIKINDKTRVIWKQYWKAIMVGGQVNQQEINDNNIFNMNMEFLLEMKSTLEKP